jgi:hypothetical protein
MAEPRERERARSRIEWKRFMYLFSHERLRLAN